MSRCRGYGSANALVSSTYLAAYIHSQQRVADLRVSLSLCVAPYLPLSFSSRMDRSANDGLRL